MKKDEMLSILSELHKISGLRVSLHGTDFEEIAASPEKKLPFCATVQENALEYKRCLECDSTACKKVMADGKTFIYRCRHGLVEVISPLYNFGTLTGYLMMGQAGDESLDRKRLEAIIYEQKKDAALAKEVADGVNVIRRDILSSYVKIMTICAEYMTLTNVMPSNSPKLPELAKIYIQEHYSEKITIKSICAALNCSKSALLSSFKNEYGTTINKYISEIRLNESKILLKTTALSMYEIADATGFYDQSYFSKVFLQSEGITPSEYRKAMQDSE